MIYLITSFAIIIASSFYSMNFAIWQFKNKNIIGGILVSGLCIAAVILMLMQF